MARSPKCVRAEIEIDAPIERVWRILTDLDRYADWNPFTPRVESTLRIGAPVHLYVRLVGERP
ncbi:MAG: SRPBCC family protein, partial [Deltaproteobacteria bacterium]